jgi:FMN phosphatase YigB (HAD superfamily)
MSQLDLIIFDMDGTLYPDNEGFNAVYPEVCLQLIMKKTSLCREKAEIDFQTKKNELEIKIKGRPTNTLVLLTCYDVSFEEFETAVDAVIDIEGLLKVNREVVQIIAEIAEFFPIVLYTTNNSLCTERTLTHLGFAELFPVEKRYTLSSMGALPFPKSECLEYIKPGHKGFNLILKEHNVDAKYVMMVGDSMVSDIEPAERLGMQTWQVTDATSLGKLRDKLLGIPPQSSCSSCCCQNSCN